MVWPCNWLCKARQTPTKEGLIEPFEDVDSILAIMRQQTAEHLGWATHMASTAIVVNIEADTFDRGLPADDPDSAQPVSGVGHLKASIDDSLQSMCKTSSFTAKYSQSTDVARRHLGAGGFGSVEVCFDKSSGNRYAVKRFEPSPIFHTFSLETSDFMLSTYTSSLRIPAMSSAGIWMQREAAMLAKLKGSPFVPALIEHFQEQRCIVMECITGGSMAEYLPAGPGRRQSVKRLKLWDENGAKSFAVDLLKALDDIHGRGVCHHDLKPSNIMWSGQAIDRQLRLVDFNLASELNDQGLAVSVMGSRQCTPLYAPPEELLAALVSAHSPAATFWSSSSHHADHADGRAHLSSSPAAQTPCYGGAVDAWGAGVIIFQAFTGELPFAASGSNPAGVRKEHHQWCAALHGDTNSKHFQLVQNMKRKNPLMASFILGLLHPNPLHRLTPAAAVQHSFLWDTTQHIFPGANSSSNKRSLPPRYGEVNFLQQCNVSLPGRGFSCQQPKPGLKPQLAALPDPVKALSTGQQSCLWHCGCDLLAHEYNLPQHQLLEQPEGKTLHWKAFQLAESILKGERADQQRRMQAAKRAEPKASKIPYWLQGEDPCVIHGSWLEWWKFVRGGLIDLAKTAIGMHLCVLAAKRYLGPEGKGPLYLLQELLLGGISYWAAKDNYAFYRMMLFGHY